MLIVFRGYDTLLEMLVALSIISIAALTLMRLDAYAVRTAGDLAPTRTALAPPPAPAPIRR